MNRQRKKVNAVKKIGAVVSVAVAVLFGSGCGRESRIVEYGDGRYGVQTWQSAGWLALCSSIKVNAELHSSECSKAERR